MAEYAFSPESGTPKRDELQPLYSQTPLIGRSFWPNVSNFGNCLYLPYDLLGCTSRFSHFSTWVGTANENKHLPEMAIKATWKLQADILCYKPHMKMTPQQKLVFT